MLRGGSIRNGTAMQLRSLQIIAGAILSCLFIWYTLRSNSTAFRTPGSTSIQPVEEKPVYDPPSTSSILGHHGIVNVTNPNLQIAQVHISITQSDITSIPLMQRLDIKLPASIQLNVRDDINNPEAPQLTPASTSIRIPHLGHSQPDVSTFIFGVATTYARLYTSLDSMSHWLSNTNTKLIAVLEPSLDPDLPDNVLKKAQRLNIPLGATDSGFAYLDRWFSLIRVLHQNRQPNTKWYVVIDDDTFFFDLSNLVKTFETKYDPSQPYYVGALTEDFQQMSTWGYMAYGGGGVFLSAPLVEQLLTAWDECYKHRNTGDRMLAFCIYKHTSTKFTWEHGLHQLDLHGDQSGFYEALRTQPLSVHHWKGNDDFSFAQDMGNLSLVSNVCGRACILQKYRFANGWVLTNGYSLVKYSDGDERHRNVDTDISMERTWDFFYAGASNIHFEHSLGPIRKGDEGKVSFRMESAVSEETDNASGRRVRQLYVKRRRRIEKGDGPGHGEVEGVVEIAWDMA